MHFMQQQSKKISTCAY